MTKETKKRASAPKKTGSKSVQAKKAQPNSARPKKAQPKKTQKRTALTVASSSVIRPPRPEGADAAVMDRIWSVVMERRNADPAVSHSARLLARGTAKVAQKFGEEAVECLIEAVAGNRDALVAESADVLYHLVVLWVDAGLDPGAIWAELAHREGVSGVAEKASRTRNLTLAWGPGTSKIP